MTRKKSNVKALALAVTCAILAGGGIGLEPVYAAGLTYNTDSHKLQNDGTDIGTLTVGNVTIHGTGASYGITIGDDTDGTGNHVMISNQDISATGAVHASTISSGKLFAQNGLYIGTTDFANPTKENSKFYVDGGNGSFKAAGDKFAVSGSGAITADSLTLSENYNVKDKIEANKKSTEDNKAAIGTLETKTKGITRVDGNSTTVDGVNFKEGAVSGVKSINGDIEFDKAGTNTKVWVNGAVAAEGVAANNITANSSLTVGNATDYVHMSEAGIAVSGRLYSSLDPNDANLKSVSVAEMANTRDNTKQISYDDTNGTKIDSDVIINEGKKNQVKITKEEGIVVGLNSSVVNADGVFAGGHNYTGAKAALNASDGSIKGADGKFGVDKDGALKAADEKFGVDKDGNVTTEGALKGKTLGIGGAGNEFTVDEDGNTNVGGTLGVTGKTTLSDELQVDGKATFGDSVGSQTVINGGNITADGKLTSKSASIGVVGISDTGDVTGISSLETNALTVKGALNIDGDIIGKAIKGSSLEITGAATVGGSLDVTGNVTGAKINGATINENSFNGAQITNNTFNGVTLTNAGDVTAKTITGTTITDGVASMNAGTVTGTTITDGNGFTATNGNVIAKNINADNATIAGVKFEDGGHVSNINSLTATGTIQGAKLKVDDNNYLDNEGLHAKKAVIDKVVIEGESIKTIGANGLNVENVNLNNGAITANSATIGGVNTLDNNGITVDTGKAITLGASIITNGKVKVSDKTSLTNEALVLNDTNKWTQEGGLVADKATVNGVVLGDAKGKATFTDDEGSTTIAGKNITTGKIIADELLIDRISLGKNGNNNISIDDSGNVTTKGEITITDATNAVMSKLSKDKATFGKDTANQTVIENGKLNAKAEDNTHQQAELKFDEKGFVVSGQTAAGQTSAFGFNTKTGIGTFKGLDQTTTTVNGSVITSTNSATDTGVLNGSNLTLVNGANKTELTAGGVTFTGKKGASTKEFNTTKIDGGVITTDTLKVQRIQLGEKIVDERTGKEIGSGVTLASDGGFTAAGGNFMVTGGTTGNRGSITNVVGDDASGKTSFTTNQKGAKMSFKKGDVTSNVSVADGSANVSAGAGSIDVTNDSITNKVGANASSTMTADSITDKVGGTVVETKDGSFKATGADGNGMAINTNTGTTTFTGKDYKDATAKGTTVIDGNTITTGKLVTDELVITGKGDAAGPGTGSLAFGGNGTIKSDVKEDGSTNNTQFTTDINGVNTMVTDGTTTTENKVTAAGNSNTVTKGQDKKSEFNQGLTSIGGVVTNGKINVAQYLDGETGLLTNEVKDANGSSKLEQSSTGLTYTDSAKPDNATRINSSDVSIGSATNDKDRINLSDLGQIDELDKEIRDNEVYQKNETAVGGINAEAAIRREEVARLDGRINDVNDRVNKVGAMAAAIASLKSIGYDPQAPSEFSIGLGQYKGETGVAMGFFHYPNKNFMINVSLSTAGGETMGGIGATWRFGHKSPQKLLEEQREAQAKKELAAAEKYQAAAKLAKEAQERAEYAAKLARQAQVSADNAKAAADATQAKHFG